MGKLLTEAKKRVLLNSQKHLLEIKRMMEELKNMTEEEKKEQNILIEKKMDEYEALLIKEIEQYEHKGKGWDFSKEKELEILVESDALIVRNIRETEKEKYLQIKIENSDTPQLYEDEEFCERTWKDTEDENAFCCAVIRKNDQKFLGYVALKNTSTNLWEIGIEFLQEYCHMGYGTAALRLFLPAITDITGKTQFQTLVETDNIPSQKLMEKLGARLVDIYDYVFHSEEEAEFFEEEHLNEITDRMVELAGKIGVEPRKLLSHVLDYRILVEDGEISNYSK